MNSIVEKYQKIDQVQKELILAEMDLIDEVLKVFNLQSIGVDITEEYNDNNYYSMCSIRSINGVDTPYRIGSSFDIEMDVNDEFISDDFKKFLFATNLTFDQLYDIVEYVLGTIPAERLMNYINDDGEIRPHAVTQ